MTLLKCAKLYKINKKTKKNNGLSCKNTKKVLAFLKDMMYNVYKLKGCERDCQ